MIGRHKYRCVLLERGEEATFSDNFIAIRKPEGNLGAGSCKHCNIETEHVCWYHLLQLYLISKEDSLARRGLKRTTLVGPAG